jgi:hypothetical protein
MLIIYKLWGWLSLIFTCRICSPLVNPQEQSCESDEREQWTYGLSNVSSQFAQDFVEMINEVFEFWELDLLQVEHSTHICRADIQIPRV